MVLLLSTPPAGGPEHVTPITFPVKIAVAMWSSTSTDTLKNVT
jgi:hypothetical protein